ncbi:MAG: hypothetical protein ACRDSG_10835 [Pseudonocardiaceae bacterium]
MISEDLAPCGPSGRLAAPRPGAPSAPADRQTDELLTTQRQVAGQFLDAGNAVAVAFRPDVAG